MEMNIKKEKKYTTKDNRIYYFTKRILGLIISIAMIIPLAVIIVIFGIIIKADSPGPIFFIQERIGENEEKFNIIKLRTMFDEDDSSRNIEWTQFDDPRVTKVGRFMRKYRIDELPQFLNVIRGDMCIVGPRPETPFLTEKFDKEIGNFKARLMVKPGITGLAQVNGGYEHTPTEKLNYDLEYIDNFSLKQDIKILLKTVKVVLTGYGSR